VLLGRERELAALADGLATGVLIAVLGEAGIGKTALLREAAAASGRTLHETGGLSTLSWLPYLAIRRVLGRSVDEGDRAYVAADVERAVGDGILLLDDLHWCDGATRALLPLLRGRITLLTALRQGDPGTERALHEVNDLGAHVVELCPLDAAPAQELARQVRPELSQAAVEQLVRQAGGNPLLVEELAAAGGPTESIRLALAARLRLLSPAGRKAMGKLGLLGRPAPSELLGEGTEELLAVGLATAERDTLVARHPLLAETAVAELGKDERRRLHGELAARISDPGEAARHHAAADERELALAKALDAARGAALPGERAEHLAVAAECAEQPDADALRLRAAAALDEIGDHRRAEELLAHLETSDPALRAESALVRWRSRIFAGDTEGARAALAQALATSAASGTALEVRLRIADARLEFLAGVNERLTRKKVAAAVELVEVAHLHMGPARYLAGSVALFAGGSWEPELRAALAHARAERDLDTEFSARNNLVFGLLLAGRSGEGRTVAREGVARARRRRMLAWVQAFGGWTACFDLHDGALERAVNEVENLLAEPLEPVQRALFECYLARALADLGRGDEAIPRLEQLLPRVESDPYALADALRALTDVQLAVGRTRNAVATADLFLDRFSGQTTAGTQVAWAAPFVHVARAWARHELALDHEHVALDIRHALTSAAPVELAAIAQLGVDDAAAAELFANAAEQWSTRDVPSELRCLAAAGEALRRAGDLAGARAQLESVEPRALALGMRPLLGRIQRSLRLAGVPRAATRTRAQSGLTGRESQVLMLVADGLSNAQIAQRLGIGRPTVARLVQSASRKLGARSRLQAALLATRP
jgi:DNA-binding CsgD family transcriptional regulator